MRNDTILSVKGPQEGVSGPYMVIHKDDKELWAIVALDWYNTPSLGIRWFSPPSEDQSKGGYPSARGSAMWFILPGPLHRAILAGLPLDAPTHNHVMRFLMGCISGDELQKSIA